MIISCLQDLLTRVEEAVDRFLYWDEEITIIEAVTNVSYTHGIITCFDVGSCDLSCDFFLTAESNG